MKFEENRSKTAAVTVLPFFRQYGRHDVIVTAKFLKTRTDNSIYILSEIKKKKIEIGREILPKSSGQTLEITKCYYFHDKMAAMTSS